ncbi:MAG: chemotaxis protein CheW [bacterium]
MADAEQQELLLSFVEEGNELLDESEPLLIELETNSTESGEVDSEVLNTIFRLYHSLKGGAGFLDLRTVGSVTHRAETLLDLFRKGKGTVHSEHIDLLTRTCDFLRKLLGNIESELTDEGFEEDAQELIGALQKQIATITGEEQEEVQAPPAEDPAVSADEECEETAPSADDLVELKLSITPEMTKQFVQESDDLLAATEEAFLVLEKEPNSEEHVASAFRALHSFKGNAGFLSYVDLEQLSHQAETVLDKIRYGEISGNADLFSMLLDVLDFLRDGVQQVSQGNEPSIPSAPGLINLLKDATHKLECAAKGEEVAESTSEQKEKVQKPAKAATEKQKPKTATPKAKPKPKAKAGSGDSGKVETKSRQTIRVDVEKLEALLDLVGELVIAEAMVAQNPDLQGLDISLENFEKSSLHLNKITRDLQDIATSIRMVPLSGVFRRMIRLVRDLAQKTGKKVELEIIGEETEVDKTVIEQITDPLVHIIRNSIDHGIGKPDERKKYGKGESGHLTLEARYVGGEVWITVRDDGMGLNRVRILEKALERGLVEGNVEDMRDQEVWQLIFHPGFSTSDKITDVSGRGVGMDVVRRNIENIRGKVDMASVVGQGTEVVLRIPLTLAIIDGMIIRVGHSRYIIPIVGIKETIRASMDDITQTMDGQEIISIRDNLYPIVRLHEFYGVEPTFTKLSDGIIMMVEDAERRFCLFVDELIGQQQIVIKGLSEYIGQIQAISGCTILGDGTVCLIIDLTSLANLAEAGRNGTAPQIVQEAVDEVLV